MTDQPQDITPRVTFEIEIPAENAELFKAHQMQVSAALSSALLVIFGYPAGTPARVRLKAGKDMVLKGVQTLEIRLPREPDDMEVRAVMIGVFMTLAVMLEAAKFRGQDFNQGAGRVEISGESPLEWNDAALPAEMLEAAAAQPAPAPAPVYKLFAVQEDSEIYAAESAEQARAFVADLIGEEIPENEVWEVGGGSPVQIYVGGAETFLDSAGVKLPEPENMRFVMAGDGTGALCVSSGKREKAHLLPRPLYLVEASVSRIWLTQAEVAAACIKDGARLPCMVCSAYE